MVDTLAKENRAIDPVQRLLNERQELRDRVYESSDRMEELAASMDSKELPATEKEQIIPKEYHRLAAQHGQDWRDLDKFDERAAESFGKSGDEIGKVRWAELRKREEALAVARRYDRTDDIPAREKDLRDYMESQNLKEPHGRQAEANVISKPLSSEAMEALNAPAATTQSKERGPDAGSAGRNTGAVPAQENDSAREPGEGRERKEREAERAEATKDQERAEASAAAAALAARQKERDGSNEARDESAFNDARTKRAIPVEVEQQYGRSGNRLVSKKDPEKTEIIDHGNRLQTNKNFDDRNVQNMIEIAKARGWAEIKVRGDEAFRRQAWIEAQARGIEVKGYKPSEQDIERASQKAAAMGNANLVEKNEDVERYRKARGADPEDRKEIAAKDEELRKAFAMEAAGRSFAKQRLKKENQAAFVQSVQTLIERDLAAGKPLPDIQRQQEAKASRAAGEKEPELTR